MDYICENDLAHLPFQLFILNSFKIPYNKMAYLLRLLFWDGCISMQLRKNLLHLTLLSKPKRKNNKILLQKRLKAKKQFVDPVIQMYISLLSTHTGEDLWKMI